VIIQKLTLYMKKVICLIFCYFSGFAKRASGK
jgi:hypothetical protein